jgi:isopentenyl-diphosphate delta-isomerase
MEQDEWLDLVDENDVVIGRKLRSEVYKEGLQNYRVIHLYILNSKGELWIPRRTAQKKLFPLGLDFSCAGHVESGSTYEDTLKKECLEELNLDLSNLSVRYLGKLTPKDGVCFSEHYEVRSDTVPRYNPDDFVSYEWLTPKTLLARLTAGEVSKSSLPIATKKFYGSAA